MREVFKALFAILLAICGMYCSFVGAQPPRSLPWLIVGVALVIFAGLFSFKTESDDAIAGLGKLIGIIIPALKKNAP